MSEEVKADNKVVLKSTAYVEKHNEKVGNFSYTMNDFKSPEIFFTGKKDADALAQYIGDDFSSVIPAAILQSKNSWRLASVNGVVNVDSHIPLVSERTEYEEGYTFNTGSMFDLQDSKFLKGAKDIIEGVNAGINTAAALFSGGQSTPMPEDSFITRYTGVRYLKSIDCSGISEVTYTFRMGQGGLFDAKKEVVEPVVALVCCFAPQRTETGFLKGPAPTQAYAAGKIMKHLFIGGAFALAKQLMGTDGKFDTKKLMGQNEETWEVSSESVSNANNLLYGLESGLMQALNSSAREMLVNGSTTTCSFQIGHFLYGPYYAENVNWGFDMSAVDSAGWPAKGWVKFSGLKPLLLMERFDIGARLLGASYSADPIEVGPEDGRMGPPLEIRGFHISSPFGPRYDPSKYSTMSEIKEKWRRGEKIPTTMHRGVDLSNCSSGTVVKATYQGTIYAIKNTSTFGNHIIIKHTGKYEGYYTLYAHLQFPGFAAGLRQGQTVAKGTPLGYVGGTNSYPNHLHFSVIRGSEYDYTTGAIDPCGVIPEVAQCQANSKPKWYNIRGGASY